jgi:hypothetical protein
MHVRMHANICVHSNTEIQTQNVIGEAIKIKPVQVCRNVWLHTYMHTHTHMHACIRASIKNLFTHTHYIHMHV